MKIEVGEYIRTNTGLILKYDDKNEKAFIDNFLMCPNIMKERISNHSKNIIDLVEVGDYVNGYKVIALTRLNEKEISICIYKDTEVMKCIILQDKDIKTILNKEQFENAEYRIPE